MSDSVVVPRYYLVHDTPAGARFAYPVPVLEGFPNRSWSGDPEWVSWTSTVAEVEQVGKWLIATGPLGEVTASWLPAKMLGAWRKTENPPADPYSRPASVIVVLIRGWRWRSRVSGTAWTRWGWVDVRK